MKNEKYESFYNAIKQNADDLKDQNTIESLRTMLGRKRIVKTPKGKLKASEKQAKLAWEWLKGNAIEHTDKRYSYKVKTIRRGKKTHRRATVSKGMVITHKGKKYKGGQFLPKSYYGD